MTDFALTEEIGSSSHEDNRKKQNKTQNKIIVKICYSKTTLSTGYGVHTT